jgi:hypothetical protein
VADEERVHETVLGVVRLTRVHVRVERVQRLREVLARLLLEQVGDVAVDELVLLRVLEDGERVEVVAQVVHVVVIQRPEPAQHLSAMRGR